MRKCINFVLMCLLLVWSACCGSGNDPFDDGNHRYPGEGDVLYKVALSMAGDCNVDESDEPMQTKAGDAKSYVGINVTRKAIDGTGGVEQYAHGLFLRKTGISITLVSGYLYSFEATIVTDGNDAVRRSNDKYRQPFLYKVDGNGADEYVFESKWADQFQYEFKVEDGVAVNSGKFHELASGDAYVTGGGSPNAYKYPRVHRYYGTYSNYNPSDNGTVTIPMKYKSFGLKFVVESIPDGSSVEVKDITYTTNDGLDTDNLLFPAGLKLDGENDTSWEDVYSLNNLKESSHTLKLRFTWHKGASEDETFEHSVTVNAKQKKVLNIRITGDVNTTKSGNIILDEESNELAEEDVYVNYESKK